jgi:hypothetical protein
MVYLDDTCGNKCNMKFHLGILSNTFAPIAEIYTSTVPSSQQSRIHV